MQYDINRLNFTFDNLIKLAYCAGCGCKLMFNDENEVLLAFLLFFNILVRNEFVITTCSIRMFCNAKFKVFESPQILYKRQKVWDVIWKPFEHCWSLSEVIKPKLQKDVKE